MARCFAKLRMHFAESSVHVLWADAWIGRNVAWNDLVDQSWRIMSLGLRQWTPEYQCALLKQYHTSRAEPSRHSGCAAVIRSVASASREFLNNSDNERPGVPQPLSAERLHPPDALTRAMTSHCRRGAGALDRTFGQKRSPKADALIDQHPLSTLIRCTSRPPLHKRKQATENPVRHCR